MSLSSVVEVVLMVFVEVVADCDVNKLAYVERLEGDAAFVLGTDVVEVDVELDVELETDVMASDGDKRKGFAVSKLGDVKIKEVELRPAVNEGVEEGGKVRLDVEVERDVIPEVEMEKEFIVGSNVDVLDMKFGVEPKYEAGNVVGRPEVGNTADFVGKPSASELVEDVLVGKGEVVK
ncbi:hypothetical protein PV10_04161 [Exophiala mesophila]|uniref:Uncharacterized protein n=1 Tax=Exophiala mesophila TaxID=212818 RepID=A0A0D1ZDW9_EXOME|nr:uncharacterized protein PV10_04161 [Exophiala mesophila]KIV92902.1 hypothetical protein PV10_04161 [Exophiala mesophila]